MNDAREIVNVSSLLLIRIALLVTASGVRLVRRIKSLEKSSS